MRLAESCSPSTFAAQRRYLRRLAQSATPAAAEDKFYPKSSACGSLSRAVRRRPTAADCYRTPTAVGEQHTQNRKCSPQDCAGRSLCPAEARYSHSLIERTSAGCRPSNLATPNASP